MDGWTAGCVVVGELGGARRVFLSYLRVNKREREGEREMKREMNREKLEGRGGSEETTSKRAERKESGRGLEGQAPLVLFRRPCLLA